MCYNRIMKVELAKYYDSRVCVAVSGGKDSMSLLHYLSENSAKHGIKICAVNCDHRIRGEESAADSRFVSEYCRGRGIPLINFVRVGDALCTEADARLWRMRCYLSAMSAQTLPDGTEWQGADAIATAHHLGDNAETTLFNIARGSGMSGAEGITDDCIEGLEGINGERGRLTVIRPFIAVSRREIDEYAALHGIPYVVDSTNLSDDYTRNMLRHKVIPELERAVPGAQRAIFRFSRIVAETEEYFDSLLARERIVSRIYGGEFIKFTVERAVFGRAALKIFGKFSLKDYTSDQVDRLYKMQFCGNGKRFDFLGLSAYKERDGLAFVRRDEGNMAAELPFACGTFDCRGEKIEIGCAEKITSETGSGGFPVKLLKFDDCGIPSDAVIRTRRDGDVFTKFGGGTKKLGDYFTDKKIPMRLRDRIPVIAAGGEILVICGVEISDWVKITGSSRRVSGVRCTDYLQV